MTWYEPTVSSAARSHQAATFLGLLVGGAVLCALPLAAQPASSVASPRSTPRLALADDALQQLQREATELERKQHWLGAVTQWRELLRKADEGSPRHREALEHLRELAGLTWCVHVDSKNPLPVVAGKNVLAICYEVPYGEGVRSMVTAVDRQTGQVLWTKEDAHAYLHDGDLVVLTENWQQIARINLQNGLDLWRRPFGSASSDKQLAQNRRVLQLEQKIIYCVGDTWPMAIDLESGRDLWGSHPSALPGYHVLATAAGFVCWPDAQRPASVPESTWKQASLVYLSKDQGKLMWRRPILSGEPWRVSADAERVYLSDPRLDTERPWTAVSLERGQTLWKLPFSQARTSTLTPLCDVLLEESPQDNQAPALRVFDPNASGRKVWESNRVIRTSSQGFALVQGDNDAIDALALRSGKPLWKLVQDDDLRVDTSGAVIEDQIYMSAAQTGALSGSPVPGAVKINPQNGSTTWRLRTREMPFEDSYTLLAHAGDTVLAERSMLIARPKLDADAKRGACTSLVALDAAKGEVRWGVYGFQALRSVPPVSVGGCVLVAEADAKGHSVYCFDQTRIDALVKSGRTWWW